MKRLILPMAVASLMLLASACNNGADTETHDATQVAPEAAPTPGQQLDTAIENTKDAAEDARREIKETGAEMKAAAKETGADIKEAAQDAKHEIHQEADEVKAKAKEVKEDIND